MKNQITKRQHYVNRKYLSNWKNEKEQVMVVFPNGSKFANPTNVFLEKYVYELVPITEKEKTFILSFFGSEDRRKLASYNFHSLIDVASAYKYLADSNNYPHPLLQLFDTIIFVCHYTKVVSEIVKDRGIKIPLDYYTDKTKNLFKSSIEELEGVFEGYGYPVIDKVSNEKTIQIEEWKQFVEFLTIQYFRTNIMKNSCVSNNPEINIQRIWPILHLVIGVNFSSSLLCREINIEVLVNKTPTKFITSDQPVINLLMKDGEETKELKLYYPISPYFAIILEPNSINKVDSLSIKTAYKEISKETDIELYNSKIKASSTTIVRQVLLNEQ